MANYRYAGISPFTSEQRDLFFGRDKDIAELYQQILLYKQVLLYAKSGIGKSSLLNAGVMPKLEESNKYTTIRIRFKAYDERDFEKPLQRIFTELKNLVVLESENDNTLEQIAGSEKESLWYWFKHIQFTRPDLKPILVFDQFEELFSYPEKYITEFKIQLSEILRTDVPVRFVGLFAKAIKENPDLMDSQVMDIFNNSVQVKAVYIIRSDRLSEINRLRDRIPDIQKSYYELLPLDKDQARDAIVKPAQKEGNFDSPKFEYANDALEKILKFLTKDYTRQVETTQLQIICQHIEADREALADGVVNASEIPNFKNIFFDFYNNAIAKVSSDKMESARKLVEDLLIRNHQRISLDGRICADYLPESELIKLVNTHLLRTERNTVGGFSYEISHDTLVAPILEARKIRVDKEEEAKAEAERQEELRKALEKAELERIEREKKQKQQRLIIYIVSVAAVISIVLAAIGFYYLNESQKNWNKSQEALKQLILKDAETYFNNEQFNEAADKYKKLDTILSGMNEAVKDSIVSCIRLDKTKKDFYINFNEADSIINLDEIENLKKVHALLEVIKLLHYKQGDEKLKPIKAKLISKLDIIIQEKNRISIMQKEAGYKDHAANTNTEIEELKVIMNKYLIKKKKTNSD